MEHETETILQLPVSVIGRVDIGRLLREVEALNSFLEANTIREPGTQPKLPKTSRLLDEMLQINKLNALVEKDRQHLEKFLHEIKANAPILHISFGADPSAIFSQKLVRWLRQEIHPLVLLQVGLQPNIGAGCMLRTTNKYFDFSLRQRFSQQHDLLMQKIQGAVSAQPAAASAVPAPHTEEAAA